MTYDIRQISQELTDTALGKTYHGNALYVAQDIPGLTDADRAVLHRWATGRSVAVSDVTDLQDIANRILICTKLP